MADYLEVARRALAAVNLGPASALPASSQADSTGVENETDAHAASPVAAEHERCPNPTEVGPVWAEWKAATLNRLFKEQGLTGQSGQITAATVRHSEAVRASTSGKTACDVTLTATQGQYDRVDFCARCGSTEWRWAGDAWICIGCGAPARTGQPVSAVDSAGTDEQPMSRAETTG